MTNALLKQDLKTLINSHLFCVDNLSDAEIRERLTKDGPLAHYEGQHLLGYHYFAYPNAAGGLYSKVSHVSTCSVISLSVAARKHAWCVSSTAGFR